MKSLKNKLQVLKMCENPFFRTGTGNDGDYKLYAIESLKQLKYLDYELITGSMREQAHAKYSDEVNDKDGAVKEDEKLIDQDLVNAKIDVTEGMLENIQEGTNEESRDNNKKLRGLKDYA
jgi:hypothetical protein